MGLFFTPCFSVSPVPKEVTEATSVPSPVEATTDDSDIKAEPAEPKESDVSVSTEPKANDVPLKAAPTELNVSYLFLCLTKCKY
jgi:hypothetical protein